MTVAGLKDQFEHYQRVEDEFRKNMVTARRLWTEARKDRKLAYRKWQKKLKATK
jgi:hypothetical protein